MTGLLSWRQWLIASSICAKNFSMLYVPEVSLYKAPFTIPLVLSFWMDLYHFYFFIFYALHFWGQPLPSSFFNSFSLSFWMDLYHYCCTCTSTQEATTCLLILYHLTLFFLVLFLWYIYCSYNNFSFNWSGTPGDWSHIIKQIGMFTFTGLNAEQVSFMTKEYHIYMTSDG